MRKVVLSILLIAMAAAAAGAEQFVAGGIGLSAIRQSYQAVDPLKVTAISGALVNLLGERFGFYVVTGIGYVLRVSASGVPVDLELYDIKISIDLLMGLGIMIPIAGPFSCIVGIGPTLDFTALMPEVTSGAPYYGGAYALGIGVGTTLRWEIVPKLYLAATVVGAYQFLELMAVTSNALESGLILMPSIGIGFSF